MYKVGFQTIHDILPHLADSFVKIIVLFFGLLLKTIPTTKIISTLDQTFEDVDDPQHQNDEPCFDALHWYFIMYIV